VGGADRVRFLPEPELPARAKPISRQLSTSWCSTTIAMRLAIR
jgi:hypothetical protein